MARIVVIGGGISGLACAQGILDRMPLAEVTVLEAGGEPGGPIQSEQAEGFICEAGPHGFLNSDPATIVLARRLGLEDRLLPTDEGRRGRFIFSGGRLHAFPDSPMRFLTSDLLSLGGRARVLLEPLLSAMLSAPLDGDESVGAFARRRLGNEAAERLIDPLVCGVYGGDMDWLSLSSSVPQFAAMARRGGSLVLGALKLSRSATKSAPASTRKTNRSSVSSTGGQRRLVSFEGGIGEMVNALVEHLGAALACDSPVTGLLRDGEQWRVTVGGKQPRELLADALVSAVPAPAARLLLGPLDADLDRALASIRYLPTVMVALGFREADVARPLEGFGYLVPNAEGGSVLGVLWPSSMFPGRRSPEGSLLAQAILGGARHPDICEQPDDWLAEQVETQLRKAIGLRATPMFRRIYRHRTGLPQYDVGHQKLVARVEGAEARLPNLFLTGNAFRGVGINACTADAQRVVTKLLH